VRSARRKSFRKLHLSPRKQLRHKDAPQHELQARRIEFNLNRFPLRGNLKEAKERFPAEKAIVNTEPAGWGVSVVVDVWAWHAD